MALARSRFAVPDQINLNPGENRSDNPTIQGTEVTSPDPEFSQIERFGNVDKILSTKTRQAKRQAKRNISGNIKKYFREVSLTEDQKKDIEQDIKNHIEHWKQNRSDLESKLKRWNYLTEGITEQTNFPWPGASNLHIPITGIHLSIFHSAARQTMFSHDNIFTIDYFGLEPEQLQSALKQENFLNYKCSTEIGFDPIASDLVWCAGRDGVAIAQVHWVEDLKLVKQFHIFDDIQKFQEQFPTPESLKIASEVYESILNKINTGEEVELEIEILKPMKVGPQIDIVELNDFVMSPVTAYKTKFANFVGKRFTVRLTDIAMMQEQGNIRKDWKFYDEVKNFKHGTKKDSNTKLKDRIEGLNRPDDIDEIEMFDGIHRFDLNKDGIKEDYLCLYNEKTGKVGQYWTYAFNHGQDCFIPIRIISRPNRFVTPGIPEMLEDINLSINTLHNQRTNSRTITSVPTFKAKKSIQKEFDPTRKDQTFIPGRVYWLTDLESVKQFDIKEVDFSQTTNEENNLYAIADQRTGASQLRSGRESRLDPRAPALKVQTLLQQSNIRLDDNFQQMSGNSIMNEGFAAIGYQILELYKQFGEENLDYPAINLSREISSDNKSLQENFKTVSFKKSEIFTDNIKVRVSKTSVNQNPEIQFQKQYTLYQILGQEPLIAGNIMARIQMLNDLLSSARAESLRRHLPIGEKTPELMALEANIQQNLLRSQQQNVSQGGVPASGSVGIGPQESATF